jgi:hypothetical protein
MLDEATARRGDFRPGRVIRLADGQGWTFPAPPEGPDGPTGFGPTYEPTVAAIWEAEDDTERLRAELALAIGLLARNYDLDPEAYQALLDYPPGNPGLAKMQCAFHELACEHVQSFLQQGIGKTLLTGQQGIEPRRCGPMVVLRTGFRWLLSLFRIPVPIQNCPVQSDEPIHVSRPAIGSGVDDPGGAARFPSIGAF